MIPCSRNKIIVAAAAASVRRRSATWRYAVVTSTAITSPLAGSLPVVAAVAEELHHATMTTRGSTNAWQLRGRRLSTTSSSSSRSLPRSAPALDEEEGKRRSEKTGIADNNNETSQDEESGAKGGGGGGGGYTLSYRQRRAIKRLTEKNTSMLLPTENDQTTADDIPNNDEEAADKSNNNNNIQHILHKMEQQQILAEIQHSHQNPTPWSTLLTYPSRANWRSSPQTPPQHLTQTQAQILKSGKRTNKQLKRTFNNKIIPSHTNLALRRERERRRLVNYNNYDVRDDSLEYKKQVKVDGDFGKAIYYNPESTLSYLQYRLIPNYFVVKRVLEETKSLLGCDSAEAFKPKRIVDVGVGCGSSSIAAMDVFDTDTDEDGGGGGGLEWIHGIDPSTSMRDCAEYMIQSVIEERKFKNSRRKRGGGVGTRVTFGESLTSSSGGARRQQRHRQQQQQSFDLALYTYTASELPNVTSTLAATAILWEKLRPNGILVMIEPGTPDGFNSCRAVRSMLLDCCPPDDMYGEGGEEECHVIAPCTHNGSCPMERHKKNFHKHKKEDEEDDDKKNNSKERPSADTPKQVTQIKDGDSIGNVMDGDVDQDDWSFMDEKPMDFGAHPDWLMDANEQDDDDDDEEENHSDDDDDDDWWDGSRNIIDDDDDPSSESATGSSNDKDDMPTNETDAFDSAFCSFVHALPGGGTRRKSGGEKFSYLVVQKRIRSSKKPSSLSAEDGEKDAVQRELMNERLSSSSTTNTTKYPFHDVNVTDLLADSYEAARPTPSPSPTPNHHKNKKKHKKGQKQMSNPTKHQQLLHQALQLEDAFLDSDVDPLGLELVKGDHARKTFGRIVRAPIKKKGHVLVDYCAGRREIEYLEEMMENEGEGVGGIQHDGFSDVDEEHHDKEEEKEEEMVERGRIIRHRVGRGWTTRVAPGMYAAARKARWGGLWPDVSERWEEKKKEKRRRDEEEEKEKLRVNGE